MARLLVALLAFAARPASAAGFSFVSFFEGEWLMAKIEPGKPPATVEYRMASDGSGGLRGVYVDGEKQLEIAVLAGDDTSSGQFVQVIGLKPIFSYDFSAFHDGAVQISTDVEKRTTFAVTGSSSFLLMVATAADGDAKGVLTKTWAGQRKGAHTTPVAETAQPAAPLARKKSLFRRYGWYMLLAFIGLLFKQAYDSTAPSKGAAAAGGSAKPAAKAQKSKKAN